MVLITGCGAWLLQKRDGLISSLKQRALNCFSPRTVAASRPHQGETATFRSHLGRKRENSRQTIAARTTTDEIDPKIKNSRGLLSSVEPNWNIHLLLHRSCAVLLIRPHQGGRTLEQPCTDFYNNRHKNLEEKAENEDENIFFSISPCAWWSWGLFTSYMLRLIFT